MVIALTIVAMALAGQPSQSPKEKWIPESQGAQNTATTENTNNTQKPTQPHAQATPTASHASTNTNQSDGNSEAENVQVQRWIEIFTGVLAGVGILQLVVMFLTWLVYSRQAKIMTRQAHETKRQRAYMRLQWNAMKEQTKLTEKQFSISHRPWCAFAELPKAESVLRFDNEGGKLEISYTIRNGGTAPAVSVATVQELAVSDSQVPNPNALKERLEQLAPPNFVDTITGFGGTLLLPEATMDIPPSQVKVLKMALDKIQGNKISLFLFLCIAYRDESKAIHKTGAVYIFVGPNSVRSFQPQGVMHGRFERFGVGYAD